MTDLSFQPVDDQDRRRIDRWIPWMFVGFFLLLFILLGDFVRIALSRFEGVVSDDAYEQGLAYNKSIDASQRMRSLGWRFALHLSSRVDGRTAILLTIVDRQGASVDPESIYVRFQRPTVSGFDRDLTLRLIGDTYQGDIMLPVRGVWDVGVLARQKGVDVQYHQRIIL